MWHKVALEPMMVDDQERHNTRYRGLIGPDICYGSDIMGWFWLTCFPRKQTIPLGHHTIFFCYATILDRLFLSTISLLWNFDSMFTTLLSCHLKHVALLSSVFAVIIAPNRFFIAHSPPFSIHLFLFLSISVSLCLPLCLSLSHTHTDTPGGTVVFWSAFGILTMSILTIPHASKCLSCSSEKSDQVGNKN